jgi:hypothetical protein
MATVVVLVATLVMVAATTNAASIDVPSIHTASLEAARGGTLAVVPLVPEVA